MEYTASLNAHEGNNVRDFVKKTNTEPIMTPPLPPRNKFLNNNYTLPTEANLMGN